ncbi:hypothetical protein TRFO_32358 [Tritrichomonas foetus]|uniref:Uncharacterized protein n=1 Tax=Tritrichomonas foetus TaxID=1144522 RepID=A0A1J4JTQ9_9EUKA|nr:hypothetical protein TRFO_32358 [Tritrichomonas foetus]|eukprot:OHT00884.1 hypothetical protein TRFO_32358 [Tritrichomonas foetus]
MNDTEYLSKSKNEPLVAMAVASFDLLSGIKVGYRWLFTDDDICENLDDVCKIMLCNVHRQNEQAFECCATSTIELQCFGWYVTNAIFLKNQPNTKKNIYISVGLVFKSEKIKNNPHLSESLIFWTKIFANCVKTTITKNEQLSSLRRIAERVSMECNNLISAGILELPPFNPSPADFYFYSILLTSHIQTQMRTVIESSSPKDAQTVASFLASFMIPFQLELSSLEHRQNPVSGFFLQCVERQKQSPEEHMITFQKPVTWLRLPERQILRTSDLNLIQTTENYTILIESTDRDDQEVKSQFTRIKNLYKVQQMTSPSHWALNTNLLLNQFPKLARKIVCEQQLAELLRTAFALISIQNGKPEKLTAPILKLLRIQTQDDAEMVLAIAKLYDHDIARQIRAKGRI